MLLPCSTVSGSTASRRRAGPAVKGLFTKQIERALLDRRVDIAVHCGALDGERAMLEALLAIRRAGGDIIITYAAEEVAGKLLAGGVDA